MNVWALNKNNEVKLNWMVVYVIEPFYENIGKEHEIS